eukprot:541116_1
MEKYGVVMSTILLFMVSSVQSWSRRRRAIWYGASAVVEPIDMFDGYIIEGPTIVLLICAVLLGILLGICLSLCVNKCRQKRTANYSKVNYYSSDVEASSDKEELINN